MNNCTLCKREMPNIRSLDECIVVRNDWNPIGVLCSGCGEKIKAGKITNVIEAAIAFMDQLNSFNDFNHPEVHKRALELSKAVGEYHAP